MRAMVCSATLRAAWRSCSLALRPADGDVSLGWGTPSPALSPSPSLSPGTFPHVDLSPGARVQHEAVVGAQQALAEGAAPGHLGQVHAPRRIRHLRWPRCHRRGATTRPPPCPSVCPCAPCTHHSVPWPCPALCPPTTGATPALPGPMATAACPGCAQRFVGSPGDLQSSPR